MPTNAVLQKTIPGNNPLRTDPSRCLPMRFKGHPCHECVKQCRSDAVFFDASLSIHQIRCTACMLCVAACPSEALVDNGRHFSTLPGRLRQIPKPVVACHHYSDVQAHEKTACLGLLGEEALIVLAVNLPTVLQLNLIRCRDCSNGFIVEALKRNLESAARKTGLDLSEKIICIEDKAVLEYQERVHTRRDFFATFKKRLTREVIEAIDSGSPPKKGLAYNHKTLPVRRTLLNEALSCVSEEIRKNILTNYFYDTIINEHCDGCAVCVAVCPTGALDIHGKQHAGSDLIFDASRCHGCELCAISCRKNAIRIKKFHGKAKY